MEKKHAYLIMAHTDFESLKYLMMALDDERNDIFIHIEKNTKYVDFAEIKSWIKNAGIFFVRRIHVRWGYTSFVRCELNLLKAATTKGNYHYYHFLSGIDFPLKSQDEIHAILENDQREYITYHHDGEQGDYYLEKIKYYHIFMRFIQRGEFPGPGRRNAFMRWLCDKNWKILHYQETHGVDRLKKYPYLDFVKGDNWCSITDDFARFVLSKEKQIYRMSRFANTPDEFFMQTIAYNSSFKDRLADQYIRFIDWNRGNPYEFTYDNLKELKNSPYLFARKINYVNEPKLVRGLMEHIGLAEEKAVQPNPLVSIVVPIYNVEDYLDECLVSLKNQTYSNIEVLLIDDESTDSSANIAKNYAANDPRFIYIRQKNMGLSGARNTGIDNSKGQYLSFVDSDDWVEPDYVEKMLARALQTDADVTVCGFIKEEKSASVKTAFDHEKSYSSTGAMRTLGNIFTKDYLLMILAWNKLYKRDVFKNIRYPLGKIHEDEYTIHHVIDNSNIISTTTECLYHYRIRNDSITGAKSDEDLRHFDVFDAHLDRVACCRRQRYGAFYRLIVYSMFEELIQLMFRYSNKTYKKHGLSNKFRWLMLRECIKNYPMLDKHQKKEYALAIISPLHYVARINKISANNN